MGTIPGEKYLKVSRILLLVPFFSVIIAVLLSGVPDMVRSGDGALLDFSTRRTAEFHNLLGPYSRFGFNHPGPLYFITRIPVYYLFGCRASADYISAGLIWILSILGTAALLKRNGSRKLAVVFCIVTSLFLWNLKPGIWLNDWNPFIIIPVALLALVAMTSLAAGEVSALIPGILAWSFVMQTHLGTVPSMSLAAVFSALWIMVGWRRGDSIIARRALITACAVTLIIWLPPLVQQLLPGVPGNIGRIAAFLANTPAGMTPGQSIVLWVHSVSGMDAVLLPAAMLKLCGMLFAAKAALLAIRIILLLVLRFAPVWKTGRDFLKRFIEMILLMHLAALISILQLRGEPHAYLLVWFSILSPLSWSVIASHAAGRLIASIDGNKRMVLGISGLLILGFMAFLNTSSIWKDRPGPAWDPLRYGDVSLARMADSLEGSLSSDSASSYVLVPQEHDLWPVMTGLLNRLDKRGISVYVPSEYSFMTGMVPPGPATGLVIRPSRPAGSVSFSSRDGYVLAANDSCQVIFAEGTLD